MADAEPKSAERGSAQSGDHIFNDDLLAMAGDLEFAGKQFPKVAFVLDHPELRQKFAEYERKANSARSRVRAWGLALVIGATTALVSLTLRLLYRPDSTTASTIIELGGALAAIAAASELWIGPAKRRWLESRLMAERLRQWHFQLIARRGKEIVAALENEAARKAFQKERERWFDQFLKAHEGKLDSKLEAVVYDPLETLVWLHEPATTYDQESPAVAELYAAYRQLRLDHQYAYALHKLKKNRDKPFLKIVPWRVEFFRWPPAAQQKLFSWFTSVFFGLALLCSGILIAAHVSHLQKRSSHTEKGDGKSHWEDEVCAAGVILALLGAAVKTLEGGFAVDREIERYQEYRDRIHRLTDHFKRANDLRGKVSVLQEFEYVSVGEMQDFLRAHHNAKFVLA